MEGHVSQVGAGRGWGTFVEIIHYSKVLFEICAI